MATPPFSFKIDDRDMRRVAADLAAMPNRIPQAIAASINRALGPAKRAIIKGLVAATTLPRARATDDVIPRLASKTNLVGSIVFSRRPAGAINFRYKIFKGSKMQRAVGGGGAAFKFMKSDPFVYFAFSRRVFKAKGLNNNTHLFYRKRKSRLPLKAIYGPSLRTVFLRTPSIITAANIAASEAFRKRLYSQIDRFLKRTKTAIPSLDSLA